MVLIKLGKAALLCRLFRESVGIPRKYTPRLFPSVTRGAVLVTSGLVRSGLVLY